MYATLLTAWRRESNIQHHYRPGAQYQPRLPIEKRVAAVISLPHVEELPQIGEEMDGLLQLRDDCRMGIVLLIEKDLLTSTDTPATLSRWRSLVSDTDEEFLDDDDLTDIDSDAPLPSFPGELVIQGMSLDQVVSEHEYAGLPKMKKECNRQWILIMLWHPSHPELKQDHSIVLNALVRNMQEHKQVHVIRNQQPLIRGKLRVPQSHRWDNAVKMEHGTTPLPQHPGEGRRVFHRPQGATIYRIPDEVYDTHTADPESHLLPETTNDDDVSDSNHIEPQTIAFCRPPPGWRVSAEGRTIPPTGTLILPPFIGATDRVIQSPHVVRCGRTGFPKLLASW
jgi:hypothetical protein